MTKWKRRRNALEFKYALRHVRGISIAVIVITY
jgi:hypothetical protein